MKITNIKSYAVYGNFRNYVFLKIETDEGLYGVGEATTEFHTRAVTGCIRDIAHFLAGQNPQNIEALLYRVRRASYYENNAVLQSALGGCEMALWDILGKSLKVPVWQLLGGKIRDAIPIYGNGWRHNAQTPAEFAHYAAEAAAQGYRALKWDPFGCADQFMTRSELHRAEEEVAAVRQAVGKDVQLLIEGHGRFSVTGALEAAHMLAPYEPYYFEEPVPSYHLEGLEEVHRRCPIPLAAGERLHSLYDFGVLLSHHAVDVVQPDIIHAGGIQNIRKIAAMADSFGILVSPHNCNGPVANAATLHADAGIVNLSLQEAFLTDAPWRGLLSDESLCLTDSQSLPVPERVGLGVELNENALTNYPPQDIPDFLFRPEYYQDFAIQRSTLLQLEK